MASFPMARFDQGHYAHLDSDVDSSYDAHKSQTPYDPPKVPGSVPFETAFNARAAKRLDALRPRPLLRASARWAEFAPEMTNLLFTVAFVGLGIAVIRLQGQPESNWTKKVVSATRIAPSLFPILFSAVLGNALKVWAHFKIERGASIGTLEQLMGSQTVASAIKSIYVLRAFGFYTLILLPLWAFNPLGSQSSFRSVYLRDEFQKGTLPYSFQNNSLDYEIDQSALGSASGWESSMPMVRSLYGAALFAPDAGAQYSNGSSDGFDDLVQRLGGVKLATAQMASDVWNNVRIPEIRDLPGYDAKNPDTWLTVPKDTMVINYTSIIGLPARQTNATRFAGNTTFGASSSYHDFQCSNWQNFSVDDFLDKWMPQNYHQLTYLYNKTLDQSPYDDAIENLLPWTSGFFMDTIGNATPQAWPTIAFVSRGNNDYYATQCKVTTRYVEVNVTCIQDSGASTAHASCAASRIREAPAPQSTISPNVTGFTAVPHGYNIAHDFATILSKTQHPMTSTQTELFINDPPDAFIGAAAAIDAVELGSVPIALFQRRFGLLFNSFWKSTITPSLVVGGPLNATLLGLDVDFVNTTASSSEQIASLYALDVPWLIVFFLANIIMFAAAIGAVAMKMQSQTPDILGYVSSLTRDSEFFKWQGGAGGGSVLDGAERARIMKEDRVRVADIGRGEEVGRIAIVPEDAPIAWRRVVPGRIYE